MTIKHHDPITLHTRIKILLEIDQEAVIAALIKLNDNFSKLKNPVLRKLFAGRVSIADACRISHCDPAVFLNTMKALGFSIGNDKEEKIVPSGQIDFNRTAKHSELDARTYLDRGIDPLKDILKFVRKLAKGDRLKVISAFEPVPLIDLLNEKGYSSHVETVEEHLFYTWFEKKEGGSLGLDFAAEAAVSDDKQVFELALKRIEPHKIKYVDVRFLEMPQPMLVILEGLDELAAGEALYVYHKKLPLFLLPELDKRGLTYVLNGKSATEYDLLIYGCERK